MCWWLHLYYYLDVFLYTFFVFVCCKRFCALLYLWNLFVKKIKNKKFKTGLMTSFMLLLNLWLFMRIIFICNYLLWATMTYSESEPDFSNFAINSLSSFAPIFSKCNSESDDSESDFSSVFINLDICIFFTLYLHSSK